MGSDPTLPPYGQSQPPYGQPPPYGQSQPPYGQQPPYEQTQPPYGQPENQGYQQPTQYYGPPRQGGYMPPPPQPQKKSRRWLWITLGIIGGIIVLGCVGCGITAALGVGFFARSIGSTVVADEYYTAIKNQDYSQAYTYWDTSGVTSVQGQQVTEQTFTVLAEAVDKLKGPVTSFVAQPNTNDPSLVTVMVTRNGSPYSVQLQFKQINGNWKIVKANSI